MSSGRKPRRSRILLKCFVLVVVLFAAACLSIRLLFPRYPPGTATGDNLDIRLVGVWPTTDTIVYDAGGNRIGETLGSRLWPRPTSHITPEYKSRNRNFVFEVRCPDDVTFDPLLSITPSGKNMDSWGSGTGQDELCSQSGRQRFCMNSSLMSDRYYEVPGQRVFFRPLFGRSLGWWTPVTSVDLKLRYFYGPPGKAQQAFNGPFIPGQPYAAPGDPETVLYLSEWYGFAGTWGTRIAYSASMPADYRSRIIAYDKDGKRLVCAGTSSGAKSGVSTSFVLNGISPEDVALVTVGEQPKEKVFHNVRVAYDGECDVPPHLTETLRRIGITPDSSRDYSRRAFDTPEQALDALDVVRGPHIRNAMDVLHRYDPPGAFDRLPQDARNKILRALEVWSTADDPDIRRDALTMGLQWDFARFAPRALDAILEGSVNAAWVAGRFFEHGGRLTPADVAKIEKAIRACRGTYDARPLFEALSRCPLDAAADVLAAFARDDDPCLWWNALQYAKTKAALGQFESLPRQLKVRRLLANGLSTKALQVDDETLSAARQVLPSLLIPDLVASADAYCVEDLVDAIAKQVDREVATRTFAAFFRSVRDCDRANRTVMRMIQYVNLWRGTDFGGLGTDVEDLSRVNLGINTRKLSRDVLACLDTGRIPLETTDGYRASPGDLRVLFFNTQDAERSAIVLWADEETPAVVGLPRAVWTPSADFVFSITAKMLSPGDPGYEFRCQYNCGVKDKYSTGYDSCDGQFTSLLVPYRLELTPPWAVVIEPADSPDSVLSGTKVFSDWWARHGPSILPAIPPQSVEKAKPESTQSILTPVGKD